MPTNTRAATMAVRGTPKCITRRRDIPTNRTRDVATPNRPFNIN